MKKRFLELLIQSFGLVPQDVEFYRTDGSDGQSEIGVGWRGKGIDSRGKTIINFYEPDGFNMAIYEILKQSKGIEPRYVGTP